MKNILVPTDFSENCTKAAHLGIKMANTLQPQQIQLLLAY